MDFFDRSPIYNVLACLAKNRVIQRDAVRIRDSLRQGIPWEQLIERAESEGVSGLLYHHLKSGGGIDNLPESLTVRLQKKSVHTARNTLAIMARAFDLSKLAASSGIQLMAIQGLSVIRLYLHPGFRAMEDIDLLIKPVDADRFSAILLQHGYRRDECYKHLFYRDGFILDIHTHVMNLDRIRSRKWIFPEDLKPLWQRGIPVFDGYAGYANFLQPDPYDNVVLLAAHALKHSYSKLIWLTDIHELLLKWTATPEAWKKLIERAKFWNQGKIVLYAILLIESIFSADIPVWVKNQLGINKLSKIETFILRRKAQGFSSDALCLILWVCNIPKLSDKCKFLYENLFPRPEVMGQIFKTDAKSLGSSRYLKRVVNMMGIWVRLSKIFSLGVLCLPFV